MLLIVILTPLVHIEKLPAGKKVAKAFGSVLLN